MSKTIGQVENNVVELEFHQRVTDLYLAQPLRASCKLCEAPRSERGFVTGRVRYWLCSNCGHLNGSHEDAGRFSQAMYAGDLAADYASGYDADWTSRMESICLPEAEFLLTALQGSDAAVQDITVLDVGCGAGDFLGALEVLGIQASGVDSNPSLVAVAQLNTQVTEVAHIGLDDWDGLVRASSATVVSLIGVLEHLANPREFLNAFALSNARFLHVSVPMFSLSALLQRAFPTVAPRHLGGGCQRYLFTRRSLEYMESTRGLNVRTEWWFGSDVLDIWRSLLVSSAGQPGDALGFEDFLAELLWAHIDDLQAVLDRARACSEVHLLFERREWVRANEQE